MSTTTYASARLPMLSYITPPVLSPSTVRSSDTDRNLSILAYDRKCAAAAETQAIEQVHNVGDR